MSVRIRLMSALSASLCAPSFRSQAEPVVGSMGLASAPSRGQSRQPQLCQLLQSHRLLWYLQPWVTRHSLPGREQQLNLQVRPQMMMRAAVKKARGVAAPKTPPKAKPVAAPKTPVKAMPRTPPKAVAKITAPGKPQSKAAAMPKTGGGRQPGAQLDRHLERLGVGTGTAQAPTCIWTSRKGGKIFLAGLPMRQTVDKFPTAALQICCFPNGPESPSRCSAHDLRGGLQPGAL